MPCAILNLMPTIFLKSQKMEEQQFYRMNTYCIHPLSLDFLGITPKSALTCNVWWKTVIGVPQILRVADRSLQLLHHGITTLALLQNLHRQTNVGASHVPPISPLIAHEADCLGTNSSAIS